MKTFGIDVAKTLLKHWPYVYCPTLGSLFTKYANPEVGDIVIFYYNGEFGHTGLVIAVNGDQFTTIEGNTSSGASVIANGGAVCKKSYYNSNLPGTKFCRPDYSIVTKILNGSSSSSSNSNTGASSTVYLKKGSTGDAVRTLQQNLNTLGASLVVDGDFGTNTYNAVIAFQKAHGLTQDGIVGGQTQKAITEAINDLQKVSEPELPYLVRVTAGTLTVRASASKSSKAIAYVKKDQVYPISKEYGNYAYCKELGGWMSMNHLKKLSCPKYAETIKKAKFRKAAKNTGSVIATLPKGTAVKVVGLVINSVGNVWYKVQYDGKTGYIYSPVVKVSK